MRNRISISVVLMVAVMFGTMIACGGGGGSESVNYTGETMPSVLDTTGAVELARGAVLDTMESDSLVDPDLFPLALPDSNALDMFLDPDVAAGILLNALTREPAASPMAATAEPLAYRCISGSEPGADGSGSVSGRICGDYDAQEDVFNTVDYLQGTFTNYTQDLEGYFHGTMIIDYRSGDLRMIFRDFSFEDSLDELFLDGMVSFMESGSSASVSFNMFILVNGEGVWFNNLVMIEEDFGTYITSSINGRIYDFVDGYIDFVTLEDFVVDEGDIYPSDGTIKITGANGVSITLEVVDANGFMVYVDVDGDGESDWQTSSPQPWELN